ncbi:MAG: SelA-like pyridoxal phosphate-dependent enzyme [Gammaproteobacteria bacterium]|nr:SelA-like pyridoxal phosphate-dependent enzyme [Gammaproteobacteria bacterium]
MKEIPIPKVINAAGKLTALGGSAQSDTVASALADAARTHLDLAAYRAAAGARIAELTGAEAACVTSGAAAGIAISVASLLTGTDPLRVRAVPAQDGDRGIVLQAGHAVDFGAEIVQMIRLGGGNPVIAGSANSVSAALLDATLATPGIRGYLHVISHHCVQENMTLLPDAIERCRRRGVPVIVDAAAEEDLRAYIDAGADLVTYSGGKAIAGPTSGFIAGKTAYIDACEMQFQGIARTMKVGKEQIAGLLAALDAYVTRDEAQVATHLDAINARLLDGLADIPQLSATTRGDEAGRHFSRVVLAGEFDVRKLVGFLAAGDAGAGIPPIRTRNHFLDQGVALIDPRELRDEHVDLIVQRVRSFFAA